jgi:hypothetical protein
MSEYSDLGQAQSMRGGPTAAETEACLWSDRTSPAALVQECNFASDNTPAGLRE